MNPYSKFDSGNMYEVLKDLPSQITTAWNNKFSVDRNEFTNLSNIVLTGLGGSAISGDIAITFLHKQLKIPFAVNRSYQLPNYAGKDTLVIACSYSGNTEETIAAYEDALNKGCKIVSIGSGGEIQKLSEKNGRLHINVSRGFQPRCALGLMFFNLLKFVNESKLAFISDDTIDLLFQSLKKSSEIYSTESERPYNDALKMIGKFPVIHSSDILQSVNVRFRCQLAENSKVLSYSGIIPELNHNEIIGWEKYDGYNSPFLVIQLIDESDHPRNKLRFEITKKILSESGVELLQIQSVEKTFEARIMDLIYYTDWVSFYLAVLRKVDPTPIKNINTLKESLAQIK